MISTGQKVGIAGLSGTGKTSLFRLISKELCVDGGRIELPGKFRVGGGDQEAQASYVEILNSVLAADPEC